MIDVMLAEEGDAVELFAKTDGSEGEDKRLTRTAGRAFGMDFDAVTLDRALVERFDVGHFERDAIERYDAERDFIFYDLGPLSVRVRASRDDGKAALRSLAKELRA